MTIASVNPATGETLATFTPHDDAEVEARLAAAAAAAAGWRRTPVAERTALAGLAAELLDEQRARRALPLPMLAQAA